LIVNLTDANEYFKNCKELNAKNITSTRVYLLEADFFSIWSL